MSSVLARLVVRHRIRIRRNAELRSGSLLRCCCLRGRSGQRALGLALEAWQAYEGGNYATAYQRFLRLVREQPQDADINFGLGLAAMKVGEL